MDKETFVKRQWPDCGDILAWFLKYSLDRYPNPTAHNIRMWVRDFYKTATAWPQLCRIFYKEYEEYRALFFPPVRDEIRMKKKYTYTTIKKEDTNNWTILSTVNGVTEVVLSNLSYKEMQEYRPMAEEDAAIMAEKNEKELEKIK